MKKITLSIGLVAAILSAKSQATLNYMVTQTTVLQRFTDKITDYKHNDSIFFDVKENECITLHLYDKKLRTRKFITTYNNGKVTINILDSKDNLYLSPLGPFKLEIGKPKFIQKL